MSEFERSFIEEEESSQNSFGIEFTKKMNEAFEEPILSEIDETSEKFYVNQNYKCFGKISKIQQLFNSL